MDLAIGNIISFGKKYNRGRAEFLPFWTVGLAFLVSGASRGKKSRAQELTVLDAGLRMENLKERAEELFLGTNDISGRLGRLI
jgi:hypothetical protein